MPSIWVFFSFQASKTLIIFLSGQDFVSQQQRLIWINIYHTWWACKLNDLFSNTTIKNFDYRLENNGIKYVKSKVENFAHVRKLV